MQSNNGEGYIDNDFKNYYADNGINMKNISGMPQQNSVVKIINRTLNERAKSIKLHVGLPKIFCFKDVDNVAYVINGGPSTPRIAEYQKKFGAIKR